MSITNATTQESLVQYPSPYKVVDGNLCMEVTEKHSKYDRKLSNFTPFIKSELTIDDGAAKTKYLRLAGKHANGELLPEIEVSGKDFPSFNWLFEKWGAKCILEVGKNIREHLRYAIQQTAEYAEQQFIYQQTGWKKINGEWYFLLPGDSKFNVSLKGKLESYCGEQNYSKSDLETVYSMTKTPPAPKEVILVLLVFTFLTPLIEFLRQAQCMPKFILNIIGSTGTRKSTMAALFLCFFGIFNAGNLPMSFRDTANSIIQNAFALKDVLTCIDDFHPCGRDDERKLTGTMQALVRSYGDRTGRGRLRKDSSPMESRPPLGNAIVTSEFPPDIGESGTARYFLLELKDGERKYLTFHCPNGKSCRDIKLHGEKYLKNSIERELLQREFPGGEIQPTGWEDSRELFEQHLRERALSKVEIQRTADSYFDIGSGLGSLAGAVSKIIDNDTEDPDERRKRIEADENGSALGTVLGLGIGMITSATADSQEETLNQEPDFEQEEHKTREEILHEIFGADDYDYDNYDDSEDEDEDEGFSMTL